VRELLFIGVVVVLCLANAWVLLSGKWSAGRRAGKPKHESQGSHPARLDTARPAQPRADLHTARPAQPRADIHIAVAADQLHLAGLLGVVNSTLNHNAHHRVAFHVIAPPALGISLDAFSRTFPGASFFANGLELNGFNRRIRIQLQAIRGADSEDDDHPAELYRWAVAYLPYLVPRQRRLIWLHTDTLVQADLMPLWRTQLGGRPVAAVEDCSRPIELHLNASRLSGFAPAAAPSGCSFNMGVLLVDTAAWAAADITSRIEYWASISVLRSPVVGPIFSHPLEPRAAFQLAVRGACAPLPSHWNVFGLGRAAYDDAAELRYWAETWRRSQLRDLYNGTMAPVRALGAAPTPEGRILHFSGPYKPWLHGNGGAAARQGAGSVCAGRDGALHDCALEWKAETGDSLHLFDAAKKAVAAQAKLTHAKSGGKAQASSEAALRTRQKGGRTRGKEKEEKGVRKKTKSRRGKKS